MSMRYDLLLVHNGVNTFKDFIGIINTLRIYTKFLSFLYFILPSHELALKVGIKEI